MAWSEAWTAWRMEKGIGIGEERRGEDSEGWVNMVVYGLEGWATLW
jgi:hypothetical protein